MKGNKEKLKVLMSFQMPKDNEYIGGVASIVKCYISKNALFNTNGADTEMFNCPMRAGIIKSSKINNLIYAQQQRKNLKRYASSENVDIVHIHTSRDWLFLKDVYFAKYIKMKLNIKVVMTIHVGDIKTVFNRFRPMQDRLIRMLNAYTDKILFMSNEIREQFIDAGLDKGKAETLYNFWDYVPLPKKEQKDSVIRLIYIGSINREKGIIELLSAVENSDAVYLDICGLPTESEIEAEFKEKVDALSSKVVWHGYADREKKAELLSKSDVLVLPSYREGFPIVTLEAMAAGCALIITPVGAMKEVYSDKNAVIIKPRSSEEIEEAIRYYKENPAKLREIQENNIKYAGEFSVEKHIGELCKFYNDITA